MIIVGELINATRKSVKTAIENKDSETIKNFAREQTASRKHRLVPDALKLCFPLSCSP